MHDIKSQTLSHKTAIPINMHVSTFNYFDSLHTIKISRQQCELHHCVFISIVIFLSNWNTTSAILKRNLSVSRPWVQSRYLYLNVQWLTFFGDARCLKLSGLPLLAYMHNNQLDVIYWKLVWSISFVLLPLVFDFEAE